MDDEEEQLVYDIRRSAVKNRKKVILIEDFPSALLTTREYRTPFLDAIFAYMHSSARNSPPIIFIISEIELQEDTLAARQSAFTAENILGRELMSSSRLARLQFNPVNKTLVTRVLKDIATKENILVSSKSKKFAVANSEALDIISTAAEYGDIRSAINSLQMWAISRGAFAPALRETRMEVFHAVGKVIYNKTDDVDKIPVSEAITQSIPTNQLIGSIFENYPPSCSDAVMLDSCIHQLSDSDLFCARSNGFGSNSLRRSEDTSCGLDDSLLASMVAVRGVMGSLPSSVTRLPISIKDFISPIGGDHKRNWSSLGGRGGNNSNQICMPQSFSVFKRQTNIQSQVRNIQAARAEGSGGNTGMEALNSVEKVSGFMSNTVFWLSLIGKQDKLRRLGGEYSLTGTSDLGTTNDDELLELFSKQNDETNSDSYGFAGEPGVGLYLSEDDIDERSDEEDFNYSSDYDLI